MGVFSTQDDHPGRWHQPVSVPVNKTDAFGAAIEMVEDLESWSKPEIDQDALSLTCTVAGGLFSKESTVRVWCEGPDGIPSSSTHCRSESNGGLLPRDKKIVAEFIRKLYMRIT